MKYFCETKLCDSAHFFISNIEPENAKIKTYQLKDDSFKIHDLEKNISILNSLSPSPTLHNLLFIYMLLSELCLEEQARVYFGEKASTLAYEQINKVTY